MSTHTARGMHVGLTVPDLDAAVTWYTTTLGFRLLAGPLDVDETDPLLGPAGVEIYGTGFRHWRFAHLATPDGAGLELFQYATPFARHGDGLEYWYGGVTHIGLAVDDLPATVATVISSGGKARTPILTVNPATGDQIVYLEDPWGSILELCTRPYTDMWEQPTSTTTEGE